VKQDICESRLFREAAEITRLLLQPGTGAVVDATEIDVAPDGSRAVIAGVIVDELKGARRTHICLVDLQDGALRVLTHGSHADKCGKFARDGKRIAFLSDRLRAGDFQLYLLDAATGAVDAAPVVDGCIEYLHWSPDGKRILLAVAARGADSAGRHGAIQREPEKVANQSWLPVIHTHDECAGRRSAWIYDLAANALRQVPASDLNLWEISWCGDSALVAIASARAEEGAWYGATLHIIDVASGTARSVYRSADQLGWVSADPSGRRVAVVEGVSSDRWCVAGDLVVLDAQTGAVTRPSTNGADICHTRWRSANRILLGAHREFETLVLEYDVDTRVATQGWSSVDVCAPGLYVSPVPLARGVGDCVLLAEGYRRAPHILVIKQDAVRVPRSFDAGAQSQIGTWMRAVERVFWSACDGLQIQGWLLLPQGDGPFPLVMHVHGGPVASFRPQWQGRNGLSLANLMLLRRGFAIFQPNPRGSSGRGQEFARKVKGDLNGADTHDYLSGLDYLVERGIADPRRLGVWGASYGGNMTCWLITQDARFKAAVAVAPHTDQVSQHLLSNIPEFDEIFIGAKYNDAGGKHYQRSPIMHAHRTTTPTLNIAGARDRCTPPNQAMEFHNALRMSGVASALVIYPEEGHGIRNYPAVLDCAARMTGWLEEHMS
jgi:dipeptidyl aminopeptidase/acylaminoacyl peptidase